MSEITSAIMSNSFGIHAPAAPENTPAPPSGPSGPTHVVRSNVVGGTARVMEGQQSSANEGEGSILSTITSPAGFSRDPFSATDKDLVTVFGSQTNVATAIRMGVLTRHPATGALVETGRTREQVLGIKEQATPASQHPKAEVHPAMGVQMDNSSAGFHSALFENVPPMVMASAVADYVNSGNIQDATVNTMASHLGITPLEAMERLEELGVSLESQRVRALEKLGIADVERFDEFISRTRPDMLKQAKLNHVRSQDLSGYQKLAQVYYENLDQIDPLSILEADFGSGITARQVNGRVVLAIPGKGEVSYRAAVSMGLIRVGR